MVAFCLLFWFHFGTLGVYHGVEVMPTDSFNSILRFLPCTGGSVVGVVPSVLDSLSFMEELFVYDNAEMTPIITTAAIIIPAIAALFTFSKL